MLVVVVELEVLVLVVVVREFARCAYPAAFVTAAIVENLAFSAFHTSPGRA